mmetsp:Transcript_20717/g.57252  ORF Transcript_20717/g.57252 Transcript_20717/m.57252 type:complete len:123 (+) Transcript_20717:140-508(+)
MFENRWRWVCGLLAQHPPASKQAAVVTCIHPCVPFPDGDEGRTKTFSSKTSPSLDWIEFISYIIIDHVVRTCVESRLLSPAHTATNTIRTDAARLESLAINSFGRMDSGRVGDNLQLLRKKT